MFTHRLLTEGFREDEVSELISQGKFNEKSDWNLLLLLITLLNGSPVKMFLSSRQDKKSSIERVPEDCGFNWLHLVDSWGKPSPIFDGFQITLFKRSQSFKTCSLSGKSKVNNLNKYFESNAKSKTIEIEHFKQNLCTFAVELTLNLI